MTRQRKNLLLVVLSIVLAFACFISVMPIGNKTVSADTSYNMIAGAQARKADDGTAGLRFVSYMDASAYDADNDALSYGMLIAPLDYIQDAAKGELTKESVFGTSATYCVDPTCDKTCGKHIINLTSDALVDVTDEVKKAQGESYVEGTQFKGFKGVIMDIKEANYLRKFVGVAYIKDATDPENVDYTFATTDQEANARSVAYVAQKSLDAGIEDTANGCLANYVAKSYESIEFVADVSVALNETIVAEGDFVKGEQSVDAGEVTVAIKSGLEAYQYVGNKVLSGKAIDKEITVTLSAKSSDGAYTYTKDVTAVVDANGYEVVDDVIIGLNRADEDKVIAGASGDLAIYVNAEKVADVADTYNTSIFTEDGYQVVYAEGASGKFVFDAEVYDYAIGTKAEFEAWYTNANFDNLSAVLTADVDLESAYLTKSYGWNDTGNQGYASTFDGKGHILSMSGSGFVYGLFPYVAKTGVIKNLIFEGLRTYASTNNAGIFSTIFAGKLENVYITAKRTVNANVNGHYGFATNTINGAVFNGVVFIITSDSVVGETYALCNYAGWNTTKGLYVVAPTGTKGSFASGGLNGNWKTFTSTDAFATYCNGALPAGLSTDFYTLDNETGLPIPIKLFEQNHTTVLPDYAVGLNKQDGLKVDLGVANAGATAKVTLDGIALEDITVDGEGFITLARDNFTVEGTKVMNVKVYANDLLKGMYSLNVDVVDIAIATASEFTAWWNAHAGTTDTVALTADINLNGATLTSGIDMWATAEDYHTANGFGGTFNGCGYMIRNFKSNRGPFPIIAKTGTIKNVAVIDYSVTDESGMIGWIISGQLLNSYFQGTNSIAFSQSYSSAMFSRWYSRSGGVGIRTNNIVIDINTIATYNFAGHSNNNMVWNYNTTGVYCIVNKSSGVIFDTTYNPVVSPANKVYASVADMMAEVTKLPETHSSAYWTYDETYGLIMNSALAYKQAQA